MAVDTVPPLIGAQINYLLSHAPFSVKVEQMWSGCKNPNLLDRFTLVIPYCLDYIKWDVIYNALYPLLAPDIIFGADDESFQPYSGKSGKNRLADWNSRDPTRLLSLIMELRDSYVAYQRKRIGEVDDDRLKFEVDTMLTREVIFQFGKKYSTAPPPRLKLISSPELKALFSIEDFKLPSWLDGMCTAEYLPTVEELLNSHIKDAVSSIETRRKFILALAPHFGRPVEADSVFCRKSTFLASCGVFTFLVYFSFSLQFPKQKPALVLQSCQHFNSYGVPVKSSTLADFPWSPRWQSSEMAERVFDFLADESLNFKKYCNQLNQH
ncbi:hypothetical protein ACS0TY_013701 [Phlomoides rotata]